MSHVVLYVLIRTDMSHEIETKILDIKPRKIIAHLNALGAKKVAKNRLVVDWYRLRGMKEGKDPWYLRIRSYSDGTHEVTWKAHSAIARGVRRHKEINLTLEEPEKLADLFEQIGLEKYAHQEKDRTSYTFKRWRIDIDTYPKMPPFLEIEGKNEKQVHECIALLGLEKNRRWAEGERTLIQRIYKLDWYDMRF